SASAVADVQNLLAQAYVGNSRPDEAYAALERAAAVTPENEKLYVFVVDACRDRRAYGLGFKVVGLGFRKLPQSVRLHYERGLFLSSLDEFDQAKRDFEQASQLAQGSEIGYVSGAQMALLSGDVAGAIRVAREGVQHGVAGRLLLPLLGEALLR